jgi:pimeloyl-ACP methyl ester carboxylesterase
MPTISTNGVDLNYECLGQGEAVVLIHGLAANMAFWFPGIASTLAHHYRVIIFDLRGHGRSSIPPSGYSSTHLVQDLLGLLSYLGVQQAHVVGHSLGARTATAFAVAYPERVSTLTIADTRFHCLQSGVMRLRDWPYWTEWKEKMANTGAKLPNDDDVMDFRMLIELDRIYTEVNRQGNHKTPKLSLKNRDMGAKGRSRWTQLIEQTTIVQEFDQGDQLSRDDLSLLKMPTLAVYGEHSHCLPTYHQLLEVIPNSRGVLIPEAGHFHPAIKPKDFVVAVESFLQEHRMKTTVGA